MTTFLEELTNMKIKYGGEYNNELPNNVSTVFRLPGKTSTSYRLIYQALIAFTHK